MGKENINTAEYLKSLENIIQFQSYVLEHIHDDFSVLFNIISKSLGIDAMLTYSCTEAGMVESVVYNKDVSNPAKYNTYLNAGIGRMFNMNHNIYSSPEELPDDMREEIQKAYEYADRKHKDQLRKSGEPYIMHPIAVARIVCREMGLGSTSICSALLHDVAG